MRKLILVTALISIYVIGDSQTLIATYNGSSITITSNFTNSEKEQVYDSALYRFYRRTGCSIDSVVIDDPSPTTVDSAAYIIFYGKCGSTAYSVGFYLTKSVNQGNDNIDYYIDDDNTSVERAWSCTPTEECASLACKPKRNWFLGPVVACSCKDAETTPCTLVNSGQGITWGDVIAILGILVTLL